MEERRQGPHVRLPQHVSRDEVDGRFVLDVASPNPPQIMQLLIFQDPSGRRSEEGHHLEGELVLDRVDRIPRTVRVMLTRPKNLRHPPIGRMNEKLERRHRINRDVALIRQLSELVHRGLKVEFRKTPREQIAQYPALRPVHRM